VRAAERSEKTAVENHHYVLFAEKTGKSNSLAEEIIKRKVRRWRVKFYFGHDTFPNLAFV